MRTHYIARVLVIIAVLSVLFSGCKGDSPNNPPSTAPSEGLVEKDNTDYGFSLNLPSDFVDRTGSPQTEQYTFLYSNGYMGIGGIFVPKTPEIPLEDIVKQEAEHFRTEYALKDGFWTIVYEDVDCNEPQTIVNIYFEDGPDCYWIIQGYCPSQSYENYESQIWQYITGGTVAGK